MKRDRFGNYWTKGYRDRKGVYHPPEKIQTGNPYWSTDKLGNRHYSRPYKGFF